MIDLDHLLHINNSNQVDWKMETDLNYPKSKAFNIFLRFIQLGLSFACTIFVAELINKSTDSQFRIIEILMGGSLLLSFIGFIIIKCSSSHPKASFIIFFLFNLALLVAIGFMSFRNLSANNSSLNKLLYLYYIGQSFLYLLIVLFIFTLPFLWIQRFTNSPGNLVWSVLFLFFGFKTSGELSNILLILSASTILISAFTFIANILAGCKGTTTTIKKIITVLWFLDIILILVNEFLAVKEYLKGNNEGHFQDFNSNAIKILLQVFMLVNMIDLIFWFYGYQTLSYQNGDAVRDDLVKFGKNPQFDEQSEVNRYELAKENKFGQVS